MLDPLSAVGLAASIVSLVTFGVETVSKCHQLYKKGAVDVYRDLEAAHQDLPALMKSFADQSEQADGSRGTDRPPESHSPLLGVAKRCQMAAEALQKVLDSLKLDSSKTNWHQSFIKVFQVILKESKIKEAEKHLEDCNMTLQSCLLLELQESKNITQERIASLLAEFWVKVETDHKRRFQEIIEDNSKTLKELQTLKKDILDKIDETREMVEKSGADTIHAVEEGAARNSRELQYQGSMTRAHFTNKVDRLLQEFNNVSMEKEPRADFPKQVLASLGWKEVGRGRADIKGAHDGTCSWIFEESEGEASDGEDPYERQKPWSNFVKWLCEGTGLYWINGKPGSGKSTLMGFIYDSRETRRLLKQWAGENTPVYTASFFFWNSGEEIKRNSQGLLRSLLFQMIKMDPDAVNEEEVLPFFQDAVDGFPWSSEKLRKALFKVLKYLSIRCKIALFIDGLDEYGEDWTYLCDLVNSLASKYQSVKVCVSSRPENPFVSYFGHDKVPKLRLQDVTKDDMRLFIYDTLSPLGCFSDSKTKVGQEFELVEQTLLKAQGVWQWVWFASLTLRCGGVEYNSVEQLRARLEEFPDDMSPFYKNMLSRIKPKHKCLSVKVLGIVLTLSRLMGEGGSKPPTLLDFAFLELLPNDTMDKPDVSPQEISHQCRKTSAEWNAACMGLIDFVEDKPASFPRPSPDESLNNEDLLKHDRTRAMFAHETIRTFVEQELGSDVDWDQAKILRNLQYAILRSCQWKSNLLRKMDESGTEPSAVYWLPISIRRSLHLICEIIAKHYDQPKLPGLATSKVDPQVDQILKQLDTCYKRYGLTISSKVFNGRWGIVRDWIGYLAFRGRSGYVMDRFDDYTCRMESQSNDRATYLLACVLESVEHSPDADYAPLVEFLFAKGADPNKPTRRIVWKDDFSRPRIISCWEFLTRCWASPLTSKRKLQGYSDFRGWRQPSSYWPYVHYRKEILKCFIAHGADLNSPIKFREYLGPIIRESSKQPHSHRDRYKLRNRYKLRVDMEVSPLMILEPVPNRCQGEDEMSSTPYANSQIVAIYDMLTEAGAVSKGRLLEITLIDRGPEHQAPETLNTLIQNWWLSKGHCFHNPERQMLVERDIRRTIRSSPALLTELYQIQELDDKLCEDQQTKEYGNGVEKSLN